jgi:2-methylcitrate dehydratase PrpD
MLRQGRLTWDDYGPQLADKQTLDLTRKVRVFQDPRVEATYPGLLSGSLKVSLRNGKSHESFQRVPKGDPENFVTDEELRQKSFALVALGAKENQIMTDAALEARSAWTS